MKTQTSTAPGSVHLGPRAQLFKKSRKLHAMGIPKAHTPHSSPPYLAQIFSPSYGKNLHISSGLPDFFLTISGSLFFQALNLQALRQTIIATPVGCVPVRISCQLGPRYVKKSSWSNQGKLLSKVKGPVPCCIFMRPKWRSEQWAGLELCHVLELSALTCTLFDM